MPLQEDNPCSYAFLVSIQNSFQIYIQNYQSQLYIFQNQHKIMKLILIIMIQIIEIFTIRYQIGSKINFNCTSQKFNINLKPEKQISLSLDNINQTKYPIELFVNNDIVCQIDQENQICNLNDMIISLDISCKSNQEVVLSIQKSDIIVSGVMINDSSIIQVIFSNEQRGILSVKLKKKLLEKIKSMGKNNNYSSIFSYSNCVKHIALFQDEFKIAISKTNNSCIVKTPNINTTWHYIKIENRIGNPQLFYQDYLLKNIINTYEMETQKNNNILQVLLINEDILEIGGEFQLTVTYVTKNNTQQIYKLKNFEKGLEIFQSEIYYSEQIMKIKFETNMNVFIIYSFEHSQYETIVLEVDQYFFTYLSKTIEIVIQLSQFTQNNVKNKSLEFKEFTKYQNLKYQVSECVDILCKNNIAFKNISNSYIPTCATIIDQICYIKLNLTTDTKSLIGILPYVPKQKHILQVNKIHKGVLGRDIISHFVIPKQNLLNGPLMIDVQITGAIAYLTYQKQCNRIYCCQYKIPYGQLSIPNQKQDLFIFLQGTKLTHYTIAVNALAEKQFLLEDGFLVQSMIKSDEAERYYTFNVDNSEKGVQINCNAPHGSILLLIDIKNNRFPNSTNYNYVSSDCYIKLSKSQLSNIKRIYITLSRTNDSESNFIPFSIIAVKDNSTITILQNTPYYDNYLANTQKNFKYTFTQQSIIQNQISFKVDIYTQKQMEPVIIKFGNQKNRTYLTFRETDTKTIMLTPQTFKDLCQALNKTCTVYLSIKNAGNISLDISLLIWIRSQAVSLIDGYFMNFDTGSLGLESHFYIEVENTSKPINLYIYSTEIQIQTITKLWVKSTDESKQQWPYASFKNIPQQKLNSIVYSFSSFIHYSTLEMQQTFGNKNGIILITLRDRSPNKQKTQMFNKGSLQIAYTTGRLQMHENDQMQFQLRKDETLIIAFDIKNILNYNSEDHQVYLHNINLIGKAEISYYVQTNTRSKQEIKLNQTEIAIINVDDLKNKIGTIDLNQNVLIIYKIRCVTSMGQFLTSIATTNSEYRQLTLGVPEEFYIKVNGSTIFSFVNKNNEDLKIKLNRKQGFPEYKIHSCNSNEQQLNCIKNLKGERGVSDPDHLIVTGRSHQLQINQKSQHYCIECRYYIAFYSINQQITGSLTIIRAGLGVLLIEGKPITTKVYYDQIDIYKIKAPLNKSVEIIITSHMGKIAATAFFQANKTLIDQKFTDSKHGINIIFQIQLNSSEQIFINIKSQDSQNALYTILFKTDLQPILISDGMPLRLQNKQNSKSVFEYLCLFDSTLIIISNSTLNAEISCNHNSKINNMQNKLILNQNILTNRSIISMKRDICSIYHIEITNNEAIDFTVLANGQDFLMLPFNTLLSSRINAQKCQMYQIPIQQKTYLKILINLCESGNAIIGIAQTKPKLLAKQYSTVFEINSDKYQYEFEYTAKPGILYLEVHSNFKELEYSIEVFPFHSISELEKQYAYIEDLFIQPRFIETDINGYHQYQLTFSRLIIESGQQNKDKYNISYVILQSNKRNIVKKLVHCNGNYMALDTIPGEQFIYQYKVIPLPSSTDAVIKYNFKTNLSLSYLSIIPSIVPKLPAYVAYESYQIIQISNGLGPQLFQKFIVRLLVLIQQITKVEDQNTLNLLLFLTVFGINLCFLSISCFICAKFCRKTIQIERKPLSTSDKAEINVENSLQMLQDVEQSKIEKPNIA